MSKFRAMCYEIGRYETPAFGGSSTVTAVHSHTACGQVKRGLGETSKYVTSNAGIVSCVGCKLSAEFKQLRNWDYIEDKIGQQHG